tara:strand:- start:1435 stop:1638 length:204 start_codon:yes stop_codon:yes gene_type:complete
VSALGEEDYTHLDFGGIIAILFATMLTKSPPKMTTTAIYLLVLNENPLLDGNVCPIIVNWLTKEKGQ